MIYYSFSYYNWIASTKEIDRDYFTINADSIEAAWEKVKKMRLFPKSIVTLESINGVKVEASLRAMPVEENDTPIPVLNDSEDEIEDEIELDENSDADSDADSDDE